MLLLDAPIVDAADNFPLVDLDTAPSDATASKVVSALRNSGFLLIKSSNLPLELQKKAIAAASHILELQSSSTVVTHPTDPKIYAMLHGVDFYMDCSANATMISDLREWYTALRQTKDTLLSCIAKGLGISNDNFFVDLHSENNDSLRLLRYLPGDEDTGNRCKEHSDYGTLTLLLTDGVGGLEAFVDEEWRPVPYIKGALVVNIGSILSLWTRDELKATLHRVAGPSSVGSTTPKGALLRAVNVPRTSLAYFADPNSEVSTAINSSDEKELAGSIEMTVSEYIRWRSGGGDAYRSGIAFTATEEDRLSKIKSLNE